jgi:hypothetical protein
VAAANRNAIWYLHYYGDRISGLISDVPFWSIEQRVIGRVLYERLMFRQRQGYWPHVRKPRTFSEKIAHRKLFDTNPLYGVLADKWAVREYVRAKVGDAFLNEVYCVVDDVAELPLATLPGNFVLKATHGSEMTILVEDKKNEDADALRHRCKTFLDTPFGGIMNEVHYASIPRRIIAEQYLSDSTYGIPLDYKFWMFHGKCHYVRVHVGRFTHHMARVFNAHWEPQPFNINNHPVGPIIDRPSNLDEMVAVAERLSDGYDFVRVDLYSIDGRKIVFGEMTFAPDAGWAPFCPREYDFRLGALW